MVDGTEWKMAREGNLARTWERRLRVRRPFPARVRVWRWARWSRTLGWVGMLWGAAVIATVLAVQVMVMSYRVDQLQTQYGQLNRQQQALSLQLAQMSSPYALMRAASRFHVALEAPKSATAVASPPAGKRSRPMGWAVVVTTWIDRMRSALVGR